MSVSTYYMKAQQGLDTLGDEMATKIVGRGPFSSAKREKVATVIKVGLVIAVVIAAISVLYNPIMFLIGLGLGAVRKFSPEELGAMAARLRQAALKHPVAALALSAIGAVFAGSLGMGLAAGQALRHRVSA